LDSEKAEGYAFFQLMSATNSNNGVRVWFWVQINEKGLKLCFDPFFVFRPTSSFA
jgi:hypothetical protein